MLIGLIWYGVLSLSDISDSIFVSYVFFLLLFLFKFFGSVRFCVCRNYFSLVSCFFFHFLSFCFHLFHNWRAKRDVWPMNHFGWTVCVHTRGIRSEFGCLDWNFLNFKLFFFSLCVRDANVLE